MDFNNTHDYFISLWAVTIMFTEKLEPGTCVKMKISMHHVYAPYGIQE